MASQKPNSPGIGKDKTDEEKRYESYVDLALKGSAQLRRQLKLSENPFSFVYGPNTANPKKYYLTGVLNEVEKAAMSMMYAADFVIESRSQPQPTPKDDAGFRITNNAVQVKIDEAAVAERKMTEILIDLVGFRRVNNLDCYRHYVVLHELDSKKKILGDMHEFSGVKNQNLSLQVDELVIQANTLALSLDPNKSWYAQKKHGVMKPKISKFSDRFKAVYPHMKEYEKAIVQTYGSSYGRQSELLHSGKPVDRDVLSLDDIGAYVGRIGVIIPYVLNAIKDLGRIHNVQGILKTIAEVTKKNEYPVQLFRQRTRPEISAGDFVVTVWGDLCQVKKVIKSKYGFRAFRLVYLLQPPMPNLIEDDFPAENVRLVRKRKPLVEDVRKEILRATPELNPTTRELNLLIRDTMLHMWNDVGLKEFTLNSPSAGYRKIQQELDRLRAAKN